MTTPSVIRGWCSDLRVVEAAEGEEPRRLLAGTVVPYSPGPGEHVGYTSVGPVRYLAGALDPSARPAVDRDHDRTRLVGKVVDAAADDHQLHASVRIASTPLGDETLALAADGITAGFSATVRPLEFSYEDDDVHGSVLVVAKGEWVGLAVTPDPAYSSAQISTVAAQRADPETTERNPMDISTLVALLEAAPEERRSELLAANRERLEEWKVTAADVRALVEHRSQSEVVEATLEPAVDVMETVAIAAALPEEDRPSFMDARREAVEAAGVTGPNFDALVARQIERDTPPPQPVAIQASTTGITTRPRFPLAKWCELDFVAQAARAGHRLGDSSAQAQLENLVRQYAPIEAALDTTTTTLMVGIVPPQYTSEVLAGLPVHTPLADNCVRRAELPSQGMDIVKPAWTVLPEGDFYTTENTEPASDAIAIGTRTVDVLSWAHAVRASLNAMERSTFGGLAQNYYTQATISYLSDKEARIAEEMMDAVVLHNGLVNTTAETTVKAKIGALVTAVVNQQADANGNFRGLAPDFAALATDVYEDLSTVDTDAGVAFGQGSAQIGSMMGTLGTLRIVLAPGLDAGGIIVGAAAATELRDGNELQLRQVIVNTMSVELGVHANCAIDVEYPNALAANTDAFS